MYIKHSHKNTSEESKLPRFCIKFSNLTSFFKLSRLFTNCHLYCPPWWKNRLRTWMRTRRLDWNNLMHMFATCSRLVADLSIGARTFVLLATSRRHFETNILSTWSTNGIALTLLRWRFGVVGSDVGRINEVTLRRARLVQGWITVSGFNSRCGKFISV